MNRLIYKMLICFNLNVYFIYLIESIKNAADWLASVQLSNQRCDWQVKRPFKCKWPFRKHDFLHYIFILCLLCCGSDSVSQVSACRRIETLSGPLCALIHILCQRLMPGSLLFNKHMPRLNPRPLSNHTFCLALKIAEAWSGMSLAVNQH